LSEPSAVDEVTLVIVGAALSGVADAEAVEAVDVPLELEAVLVNVYATPFVSPVTSHDVLGTVTVQVFVTLETCGEALTVYELGAFPVPVDGATMVTVALASPATTVGVPGVPGIFRPNMLQEPMFFLSARTPPVVYAFTGLTEK
jgi:hypothetical protein